MVKNAGFAMKHKIPGVLPLIPALAALTLSACSLIIGPVFTVTTAADLTGGTVSASPSSGTAGTRVTLSNTPASGYVLSYYTLNGAAIAGNTFTLNSNVVAGAVFTDPAGSAVYAVTIQSGITGGTVSASPSGGTAGTRITLSNVPASGYVFSHYTLNGAAIAGNTFTLNRNAVAGAVFNPPEYSNPAVWTEVTNSPFGSSQITAIAYGGGRFVAAGADATANGEMSFPVRSKTAYSTDGVNWTEVTNSPFGSSPITVITYGGGRFVAAGYEYESFSTKMAYSTDGVNWIEITNSPFGSSLITVITYGGGKFVAAGVNIGRNIDGEPIITGSNKMACSTDGVTWTEVTNNTLGSSLITAIAYGGGKFVAAGVNIGRNIDGEMVMGSNKIACSPDGVTWTEVTNNTLGFSQITAIAYGGDKFVATGYGGYAAYSTDGVNWTTVSMRAYRIAYGGGNFVAAGYDDDEDGYGVVYSTDGVNWTEAANGPFGGSFECSAIAYGGGRFVAGGYERGSGSSISKMAYTN